MRLTPGRELTTVIALVEHQAVEMMANRRLCLSQEGIGHGLPEVAIVHAIEEPFGKPVLFHGLTVSPVGLKGEQVYDSG